MPLTLRLKSSNTLPIDGDWIRPDALRGLSIAEVAKKAIWVGNRRVEAGEIFEIGGDPGDESIVIEGDLAHVHRLGEGMASGSLRAVGDVGRNLAAGMTGGSVVVDGSAGDWAGAEMKGGSIAIRKDAGDGLGSAYPGSRSGMKEGFIHVGGDVGEDVGLAMRRGLIVVAGRAGGGLGRGMIAGSIFAFGPVGRWPGAGMKRGTIAIFGDNPGLLPTFAPSGRSRPPFLTIYLRWLRERSVPIPEAAFGAAFERYNGDLVEGGRGEILVQSPSNR